MTRIRTIQTTFHWGTYEVVSDGDRVVAINPMPGDNDANPMGPGVVETLDAPYRLTQPVIRRGWLEGEPRQGDARRGRDSFVAVSWDQALTLASDDIRRVSASYGNEAIYGGSYGWSSAGRFHHAQSQIHRFLRSFGGYTDSVGSYSAGAMEVILPHVIGGSPWSLWERGPMWPEIAQHADLVVSFGGMNRKNSLNNPGGGRRHEQAEWQQRAHENNIRFVNVSPLADDTAPELNAQWLGIRPNTDVPMMLALVYVMQDEGLHDQDFLGRCCVGYERFAAYLRGESDGVAKTPEWAAPICGINAAVMETLARDIARGRTVINVSWSLQRQDHGEQPYWLAVVLAAMSGSMGRPGGGVAAGLGISNIGVRPRRWEVAGLPQGRNALHSFIPVARIADALQNPGGSYQFNGETRTYPDLRLIYWAGGNPFHHHQDLNKLVRAWQIPETIIVHESWWNPLARFADIVFPVATPVERRDIAAGNADLSVIAMTQAVKPPAGVMCDYDVFRKLASRLGIADDFTEGRTADEWVDELYERTRAMLATHGIASPDSDEFWARGGFELPEFTGGITGDFTRLRDDPAQYPLATPSGKLEIYSDTIASFNYPSCPGHPVWLEPEEWLGSDLAKRFPIHLMSNQPKTRLHSQYDGGAYSQASKVQGREPILMHPVDAAARGITDGDLVRVFNDRGALIAGARLTASVLAGVVVISTGAWYDPVDPGVPGSLCRHGNPNVLTKDVGTSALAQAPTPGSTLVQIARCVEPPVPVQAFVPPVVL